MSIFNNPLELPISPVANKSMKNTNNDNNDNNDNNENNKLHLRKKPRLVISVQSPTDEEYKIDQMEKGYVSKIKSYVTNWTN